MKPPVNHIVDITDQLDYRFSVYNPITKNYQTSQQPFYGKDPTGLLWNPMDQYIAEDEDSRDVTPQLKLKRLLFGILPLSFPIDAHELTVEELAKQDTRGKDIDLLLYVLVCNHSRSLSVNYSQLILENG